MEIGLVGDQVKQWEQGLEVNKLGLLVWENWFCSCKKTPNIGYEYQLS